MDERIDVINLILVVTYKELAMLIRRLVRNFLNNVFRINIEFLRKGFGKEYERYSYQKKYARFDIQEDAKVLDVGSGGYPFPLATIIGDLYAGETSHRTEKIQIDQRPFVVLDIENLPFPDKAFDFVYCSHLLEHVDNPTKACNELMRVGQRGYLETPTRTSDIMFNFLKIPNHHRWYIQVLGNTVIFMEWKHEERRDLGTDYFLHQFNSPWANPFQKMILDNRDIFVNMLLWENKFDYIVLNNKGHVLNLSNKALILS